MITLGLHDGHGASVALFENDKLLAVIEEERPSRRKGSDLYVSKSVEFKGGKK